MSEEHSDEESLLKATDRGEAALHGDSSLRSDINCEVSGDISFDPIREFQFCAFVNISHLSAQSLR
jgi:hypothetical protein